jgi:hypothetical protein
VGAGGALAALLMVAAPAPEVLGDVPGSCKHPDYDRLACELETRETLYEVLSSARVRVLRAQLEDADRGVPLLDLERNLLLHEIRDALLSGRRYSNQ